MAAAVARATARTAAPTERPLRVAAVSEDRVEEVIGNQRR